MRILIWSQPVQPMVAMLCDADVGEVDITEEPCHKLAMHTTDNITTICKHHSLFAKMGR